MSPPPPRSAGLPWRLTDMLILYVFTAVGYGILLVAWWATSGTTSQSSEVTWLNVGAAGLMVLGTGNLFWLLTARRAVGERRRQLLGRFASVPLGDEALPATTNGSRPRAVWVSGMRHYHRPDCQLVAGKPARGATMAAHEKAGRQPCGMCRP